MLSLQGILGTLKNALTPSKHKQIFDVQLNEVNIKLIEWVAEVRSSGKIQCNDLQEINKEFFM